MINGRPLILKLVDSAQTMCVETGVRCSSDWFLKLFSFGPHIPWANSFPRWTDRLLLITLMSCLAIHSPEVPIKGVLTIQFISKNISIYNSLLGKTTCEVHKDTNISVQHPGPLLSWRPMLSHLGSRIMHDQVDQDPESWRRRLECQAMIIRQGPLPNSPTFILNQLGFPFPVISVQFLLTQDRKPYAIKTAFLKFSLSLSFRFQWW